MSLKERIVGAEGKSLAAAARRRRFTTLLQRFPDLDSLRVVDLGGRQGFWEAAAVHPLAVTCVNVEAPPPDPVGWMTYLQADACTIQGLGDFDLVFSNSTIEHVGGHQRRTLLAAAVHRLAPHHWVQTPYRYFPLEPHFVFPAMQFLPRSAQVQIAERWPLSFARRRCAAERVEEVLGIELLSLTEMRHYFPQSQILKERIGGLTKSLIAVR